MVSYNVWFEVVHEASAAEGIPREQRNQLTRGLAEYWQENKAELKAMSRAEARELAEQIVT